MKIRIAYNRKYCSCNLKWQIRTWFSTMVFIEVLFVRWCLQCAYTPKAFACAVLRRCCHQRKYFLIQKFVCDWCSCFEYNSKTNRSKLTKNTIFTNSYTSSPARILCRSRIFSGSAHRKCLQALGFDMKRITAGGRGYQSLSQHP